MHCNTYLVYIIVFNSYCVFLIKFTLSLNQEFNPELSHSINKKEKVKRNHDGVTLTQVSHGVDQGTPKTGDRGRYRAFCVI